MEILQRHLLFVSILMSSISAFTPEETEFIKNYFWRRCVSAIIMYPCSQTAGLEMMRSFERSSPAILIGFGRGSANRDNESVSIYRYEPPKRDLRSRGVLVDVRCSEAQEVLKQASYLSLMTDSLHWLLWSSLDLDDEIENFLETLPLNVDADVVLAVSHDGTLQLLDLFKISPSWSLTYTPIDTWNLLEKNYFPNFEDILNKIRKQRKNFQEIQLDAAIVLHEMSADPQKKPVEFEAAITSRADRHLDSESRFGYAIYTHLQELFNFTIRIAVTDSWGYRTNGSNFDGMIGMLNRGEVQLGITPAIFNEQRLQVVDFTTPTWRLRTCFLFRHPRLVVPYKALAQPFVETTWAVTFLTSVSVVVLLRIVLNFENKMLELDHSEEATWSASILTVVGVLSQQGSPSEPQLASGRVVIFTKLVLSVLLYAFYTSAIVTFLLTPVPRTIRTAEDLLRSPLTLALEDYSYNRAVFPFSRDSLISRIWHEKVGVPDGGGFVKVRDAVQRMRFEQFAFYSEDSTIYVPVDETFDDSEKCDLSEVELSAPSPNGAPLQKHSPYRELFNRGLLRIWEHGIRSRQRRVWSARKPQCLADGTTTIAAVGLDPVFPAHALLLAGWTAAAVLLLREKWFASVTKTRQMQRKTVRLEEKLGESTGRDSFGKRARLLY